MSARMGRPIDPLKFIPRWIQDARREIRAANGHGFESTGVRAAARQIGVSHSHLSRVLRGERASRSLMRRYRKLQEAA